MLPADYEFGYVVGRAVLAAPDGTDADRFPDGKSVTGKAVFKPSVDARVTDNYSALVVTPTYEAEFCRPLVPGRVLFPPGTMVDAQKKAGIWLPVGVYTVSLQIEEATVNAFQIEVTTAHTEAAPLDLFQAAPPMPGSGVVFVTVQVPAGGSPTETLVRDTDGQLVWSPVPEGPEGPQGLPGVNAVPGDEAVAGWIGTEGSSASQDAVDARVLKAVAEDGPVKDAIDGTVDERGLGKFLGDGSVIVVASKAEGSNTELKDSADNGAILLHLDHSGSGTPASYALDIRNRKGARPALVIHQYSNVGPAVWLDNTDSAATIRIKNAANEVFNPGSHGTGPFFEFQPWDEAGYLSLTDALTLLNATTKSLTIQANNSASHALQVQTSGDIDGLRVVKTGTGAGLAARVTNAGTGTGLLVEQTGVGVAVRINQTGAGLYGFIVSSPNFSGQFSTTTNGGRNLDIVKNATGTGEGVRVTNKGTGSSIAIHDAAGPVAAINPDGEYEHMTAGRGIILRSPDGTRYRVSVGDGGALEAVAA